MKTFFLEQQRPSLKEIKAVVLGNFDGVHRGHMELFKKAQKTLPWALMTFEPHPKEFFGVNGFKRIYGLEEGLLSFEKAGVEISLVESFNADLAQKTPIEFLDQVILAISPQKIIVGDDFQFGKNRTGSVEDIKSWCLQHNMTCEVVPLLKDLQGMKISSSSLRASLSEGDIKTANNQLCSPFFILGEAQREKKLATQLGFPTINVPLNRDVPLKYGVYGTKIKLKDGEFYPAITNFGIRPTVHNQSRLVMETHVLEFPKKLLDQEIGHVEVRFIHFIRPESRFEGLDQLKSQIKKDVVEAKDLFNKSEI